MKRKLFAPLTFVFGLFVLIAAFADLNGKWKGDIITPDGQTINAVYNFKVSGDSLTGTAESPAGLLSIDNGKVTGDKFSFKVTVEGNDYPHTGEVFKDSCSMDIDFGGQNVHVTLKRATD